MGKARRAEVARVRRIVGGWIREIGTTCLDFMWTKSAFVDPDPAGPMRKQCVSRLEQQSPTTSLFKYQLP